jgi:hypothetical protein
MFAAMPLMGIIPFVAVECLLAKLFGFGDLRRRAGCGRIRLHTAVCSHPIEIVDLSEMMVRSTDV